MISLLSFGILLGLLFLAALTTPAAAYAAALCLFGIKQWGQSATQLFSQQYPLFVNYFVALIVFISAARQWLKDREGVKRYGIVWALSACLYLYAFVSSYWAPLPTFATRIIILQWLDWYPYVLTVAIAAPFLINKYDDVLSFSKWTIYVGGLTCALALFLGRWGYRGLLINGITHADVWNETNPLAIATLGATVAICGLVMFFYEEVKYKKILFLSVIPLGVTVILRSGSRGQLISMVLALMIGMPFLLKKKTAGSGLTAFLIALVVMVVVTDQIITQGLIGGDYQMMTDRWTSSEASGAASDRLVMAKVAITKVFSDPMTLLAGIGNSGSFAYFDIYTHIAPLEIFAEEGIVGLGIYLAILILTFRNFRKLLAASDLNPNNHMHLATMLLGILFLFELFLTCKQGTLLSSIYVFAYAAMLDRLVNRLDVVEQVAGDEEISTREPIKPNNLMA